MANDGKERRVGDTTHMVARRQVSSAGADVGAGAGADADAGAGAGSGSAAGPQACVLALQAGELARAGSAAQALALLDRALLAPPARGAAPDEASRFWVLVADVYRALGGLPPDRLEAGMRERGRQNLRDIRLHRGRVEDAPAAPGAFARASPGPGSGDALTGLLDRPGLDAAIAALELRFPDTLPTLLLVGIDHFERMGDARSPAIADALLVGFAGLLRAQSRPQDVVARLDGSSLFVVVLGGPVSTTRAMLVAERMRAAVEAHGWGVLQPGLAITASLGVAARGPGESLDAALDRAASALAACRRGGCNQARCAS